jgi:Na+/H+ antiporter NhaD/arsenite permease-like protein
MKNQYKIFLAVLFIVLWPIACWASELREQFLISNPTKVPIAIICLGIFILSYLAVMTEEKTRLPKSKPVMLGAGIMWALIAWKAPQYGVSHEEIKEALLHNLDEYAGLMLFLLTAMTYINSLQAKNVFQALRSWLIRKGFSYRSIFWVTGFIAFFLSPVADNMTTALVMGSVIMAVGASQPKFVLLGCINIVVAANAGGAFSPFGDITTLMVWEAGHVDFIEFFKLFIPSLVNFALPAAIMTPFLPTGKPSTLNQTVEKKRGAKFCIALFAFTIFLAIIFEQILHLPAFMGMMTGLSLLMFFAYYQRRTAAADEEDFDIFKLISAAEWDTLLFFFGVIFSVGGLAYIGWLTLASGLLYGTWGPTVANIFVGSASAIVDNIPMMFAVLSMQPDMNHFQWILITLTCGVGGSLLSIGSAAGVALMGTSRDQYTFLGHLKWTPVVLLGYAASILAHFLING